MDYESLLVELSANIFCYSGQKQSKVWMMEAQDQIRALA